jgi:hypothetical protein
VRRPDRVDNLQEKSLEAITGRALRPGVSRIRELKTWRNSDDADLASAVERVMSATCPEAELGPKYDSTGDRRVARPTRCRISILIC